MRLLLIALLLTGLAMAFTVKPDYIEIKDTGHQSLPTLDVGITIDCDTKNLSVHVASNATGEAVQGAKTYLFYTDYTYQALPNPGTTGADGITAMPVPGTIRFLTAMFILRVDKKDFKSREIEFTYQKCFEAPPAPPPPPPQNVTPPQNQSPPANQTPLPPTGNMTPPGNQTPSNGSTPPIAPPYGEPPTPGQAVLTPGINVPQIPCLPAFLLLPLLLFVATRR